MESSTAMAFSCWRCRVKGYTASIHLRSAGVNASFADELTKQANPCVAAEGLWVTVEASGPDVVVRSDEEAELVGAIADTRARFDENGWA